MKASPIKESFNAGEFSPLMEARVRFDKYPNALKTCLNMVPLVQGGVTARSGTYFVSEVKTSSKKVKLVAFEFSTTQAYVLEFGDLYMRVYKDRGQVESSPGVAYELVTPYAEADLFHLKFTQSADVLYVAHPSYAPRKITRTGHAAWTITAIDFKDGPYLNLNTTTTTITPSATTGAGITLTASANLFASTDVGRLVRIKHSSTWGWAKITAYTSATQVTATVYSNFGGTTASLDWRLGVWSATTGYPSCVAFFEDRLFWAGATAAPQRLDGSRTGDYENFAPSEANGTVAADHAVSFTLNSSDVNVIRWLIDDEKGLFAGSVKGEWIVRPSTASEALSPTNISAKRPTSNGSANIAPVRTSKAPVYVQRAGRKVRALQYVFELDGFHSPNLTRYADHVTESGIVDMDFAAEPYPILWAVRADGVLAGLTIENDEEVLGWHRHILGGSFGSGAAVVESVACIPTPDGTSEEAWFVVKRTINGSTKRYIEYLKPFWDGTLSQKDAFFVDCGLTYNGAPATAMSGLGHLEGQTVTILADGAAHPDKTVSGGAVTLDRAASVVHIGLGYNKDVETLRLEAGAADGTAQGKTKRIHSVVFRFFETLGVKQGPDVGTLSPIQFRTGSDPMDSAPPLYTGDIGESFEGDYDSAARIFVRSYQPFPMTLLALMPQVVTQDDGQRRGRG